MKRITAGLIVVLSVLMILAGCSGDASGAEDGQLRVIATIFPQYDFVRQIAGERVELSMLLSAGMESHGFNPTARDIVAIDNADLLIYVGGHGDTWVDPILASLGREGIRTVALLELVDAVMTEHIHDHHHEHSYDHSHHEHGHNHEYEHSHHDHGHNHEHEHSHHDHGHNHEHEHSHHDHGHNHEHEHSHHDHGHSHEHEHSHHDHGHNHEHEHSHHDHGHNHEHEHSHHHHHHHGHDHGHDHHHHEPHYDEHVWTCPRNAIIIVTALTEVLSEIDADNAYYFRQNAAAFILELQELDRTFTEIATTGVRTTVVFGDRFPLRYFTDTYGLTAYAAFEGCSAETQASPVAIANLINVVNEHDIPVVFYIEFSNRLIANVIAEATGARLLEFHSAHNVSPVEFAAGVTYIDIMRRNAEVLREALN